MNATSAAEIPAPLYVGIATKTSVTHATHSALRRLYLELPCPTIEDIEPVGGLVLARNQIAARFLAHPARPSHLLMVDDDVAGFTANDVARMMASGADLVGAPLPARELTWATIRAAIGRGVPDEELHNFMSPLLMHFVEGQRPEPDPDRPHLVEVAGVSTGFLLISRACLAQMARELGAVVAHLEGRPIVNVFDFGVDASGAWIGEDFGFCLRWRSLGGKVYADLETSLIHLGTVPFRTDTLARRLERAAATPPTRSAASPT